MTFGIFDIERRAMSIYGYCRISTAKQSIDRQIRNIRAEYPTVHIVQEAYTGTSILRPEWSKLYEKILDGTTECCICAEPCACDWVDWRIWFTTAGVLHNHG